MQETLDKLPGHGDRRIITQVRARKGCDECGEFAHFKHSFLYEGMRSNPKSSAYGRDDCSWCSDVDVFTCRECVPTTPDGCSPASSRFPATAAFAHMFLEWVTVSTEETGGEPAEEESAA